MTRGSFTKFFWPVWNKKPWGKAWGGRQDGRFVLGPACVICQGDKQINALRDVKKPRTPPTKHLELSSVWPFKSMQLLCNLHFFMDFAGCEGACILWTWLAVEMKSQLVKWSQRICCSNNFDVLYCLMSSSVFYFIFMFILWGYLPSLQFSSFDLVPWFLQYWIAVLVFSALTGSFSWCTVLSSCYVYRNFS